MAENDRKLVIKGEADFNKLRKELDSTKQLLLDLANTANRVKSALTRLEGGTGRGPGANPILKALGGQAGIADIEKKMEESVSRYTKALSNGLKAIRAESAESLIRAARVNAEVNRINANSISETTKIVAARLSVAKQSAALPLRQLTDQFVSEKNAGLARFATSIRGQTTLSDEQLLQLKAREQAAELLRQKAIGQAVLLNTAEARKELELRTKQAAIVDNILTKLNAHLNVNKEIEKIQQRIERRQLTQQIDPQAQIAAQRRLLQQMEQNNIRFYKASAASLQEQINQRLIPDRTRDREYIGLRVKLEREAEKAAQAERARVEREAIKSRASTTGSLAAVSRQRTLDRIGGPEGGAFLFEIQSRLLLNYRLMYGIASSIRQGTQFVIEFEDELKRLQGISGVTTNELERLRTTILNVSEGTRFAATEVTRSAVVLAQAGLSTQQIGQVLDPIIKLAQSTGSEVGKVVDVFTSILGVFNVQTSESVSIANQLASALNVSKLDIEKFALATQYAANAAAQSNVSFSEFASVLATLSNAGIRSGSTLGTGLSQLITQLIAPSAELAKVLKQVGLTVSDVDVRSKGLIGVLETLKGSGFGAAQAFQGLDLRAARTLVALNKNTEALLENQRQILLSEAATYGSKVATDSFAASLDILRANAGAAAADITRNLLKGMTDLVKVAGWVVSGFREMSDVMAVILNLGIGVAFVALTKYLTGVAIALVRVTFLSGGLVTAWKQLKVASMGAAVGMDGVTAATGRLTVAMRLLRISGPLLLLTAFELLVNGVFSLIGGMDELTKKMEDARNVSEEASQRLQAQRETVNALNTAIQTVNERYDYLSSNEKALQIEVLQLNKQFAAQGLVLSLNTKKVDDLIEALTKLKRVSDQKYLLDLSVEGEALQRQKSINSESLAELLRPDRLQTKLGIAQYSKAGSIPIERMNLPIEVLQVLGIAKSLGGRDISGAANDAEFTSQIARTQTNTANQLQNLRLLKGQGTTTYDGIGINTQIKRLETALEYIQKLSAALNQELALTSQIQLNTLDRAVTQAGLDPQFRPLVTAEQEFARELKKKVDAVTKADPGDRTKMLEEIQQFIADAKKTADDSLNALIEGMSEEQKRAYTKAYDKQIGSLAGETIAREMPRIEKALDENNKARKKIIEEQIRVLEDELKNINSTFDDATTGGQRAAIQAEAVRKLDEIVAKKQELLKVDNEINKDKLDALERERTLNREIAARYEEQGQKVLEDQERADKLDREIADLRSQNLERGYRKQIEAIRKTLTGPSAEGLSKEKTDELLKQMEELLIAILNLKVQAIIRQATGAGQKTSDPRVQEQLKAAQDEFNAQLESIYDSFNDVSIRRDKAIATARDAAQERSYRKQIDAIRKELTGETGKGLSPEKRAELIAKIEELLILIMNIKLAAIMADAKVAGLDSDDPRVKGSIAALQDELDASLQSIMDGLKEGDIRGAREEFTRGFKTAIAGLARSFRSLNDSLDRAAKDLQMATQDADNIANRFSTRQQSYLSPQNKGRIPSVMAQAEVIEQQFEVDNTVRAIKISAQRDYLGTLQRTRDELKKLLDDAKALLREKAKIEGVNINVDDINDPANGMVAASATVNRASEEVRKYEERMKDLEQQLAAANAELGRMTEQQEILNTRWSDPTVWEALRAGVIVWQEQSNAAETFVASIGNSVPSALDSIGQAWGQFSDNLINRTMSIKDAFKELARSMLASMLKVVNDAITKQFIGILGGLIGNIGNPYSMPNSVGGNYGFSGGLGESWTNFAVGGMVPKRLASGGRGGVPTRDSMLGLIQPGEYVMRQSAVSMIGRDALDSLNGLGNRRVQGAMAGATPYQPPKIAEPSITNVWVVADKQAPPPGPKDIIAVIGQDIRNGGATKQLIKSVQAGAV